MSEIRKSLKRDLAEVCWRELRVHLQRDAIIVVDDALDLIETAIAVADDDKKWLSSGLMPDSSASPVNSNWSVGKRSLTTPFKC